MLNKVFLIGNLGKDPELRNTSGGTAVCSLSLATSSRTKDKDGNWVDQTEWHKVVVWGVTAENVTKYTKKGSKVHIEGRLQTRKWQNKDGVDQYTTEVVAEQVKFLDNKTQEGGSQSGGSPGGGGQQGGSPGGQRSGGQQSGGGSGGGQRGGSGSGGSRGGGTQGEAPPYTPDEDIPFISSDDWRIDRIMR